ncbi:HNH endonuclease signature motif containing protein [Aspergillus candidus]|uniref:Uncharacterized protein n=1 Tax=Aspergillus candidus TaxID=41067 RepID=A0A2I2F1P5_ASPCN|nr:hypothetical protein BDW47DRAFT_111865 [Aspergillus candidus]PLB34562.1 hypothetical protein BDW47DRAFT_111865 [Aspergillus candidus]
MTRERSVYRNIHFYDGRTKKQVGGLYQAGSLTEKNILWMLGNVLLIVEEPWTLIHRDSGRIVGPSDNPASHGNYDIHSSGSISVTDELWIPRLASHPISGRESSFTRGVRARDGKCVISGVPNPLSGAGIWAAYQAAHVFPLQYGNIWSANGFAHWITNMPNTDGSSTMNSVQNGLLMFAHIHSLFDQYLFSINPDDGYKIISFQPDFTNIDGKILDFVCRDPNNPDHVADEVLRWHFRQAVLGNMRGAGEPVFETDFPPGSDLMETLRKEPYGKERFEMELYRRLDVIKNQEALS